MAEGLGVAEYTREKYSSACSWLDGSVVVLIQDPAGELVDVTVALLPHLLSRRLSSQLSGFLYYPAVLADQQVELLSQQPDLLGRGTTLPQLLQLLLCLPLVSSDLPDGILFGC